MPLANIEHAFVANLLNRESNEAEFLSELQPVGLLSEEKQLSIYRSNINGAHQKVLAQIYPACLNILGEDYFNQLCRAYRIEYPSTDPDLNNYGKHFSFFIKEQSEIHNELSDFEYLSELAWLEWHWHASYYARDEEEFSFEKLALVKAEDQNKLVFKLSWSFSLYSTIYPLLDIWNANKNTIIEKQEFFLPETESYFCLSRVNFMPEVKSLNKQQFNLLKFISNGLTLTQLTELDMEYVGDFQGQLMNFIAQGWVSGFSINN